MSILKFPPFHHRGAMRELRRDNAFLEDQRRLEKEEKDAEYAKKIGAITQMLQQQEHEVFKRELTNLILENVIF